MRHSRLCQWIVLGGLAACGVAQGRSAAEEISAADAAWSKMAEARQLDPMVGVFAEDGSMLMPNQPISTGRANIREMFRGVFALPDVRVSWTENKVEAAKSGDLGYTSGTYTSTYTGQDGKPVNDHGKYVTVWTKSGGVWKVKMDMINSDLPMAGQ